MLKHITTSRLIYAAVSLGIALLIVWGATQAAPPIPKLFAQQDKLEHFLAFGALTLWITAFFGPRHIGLSSALAVLAGIGLELVQAFLIPTRSGSLMDLLASIAGVVACAAFVMICRSLIRSRRVSASA